MEYKNFWKRGTNDLYPKRILLLLVQVLLLKQINLILLSIYRFLGEYNVLNAMAAMFSCPRTGECHLTKWTNAFTQIKLSSMRMEITRGLKGAQILNDAYNASPTSVKAVIDLVPICQDFQQKLLSWVIC